MSDPQEQFNFARALRTPEFDIHVGVNDPRKVCIVGGSHWRGWFMSVDQARALHDWLNKVLP